MYNTEPGRYIPGLSERGADMGLKLDPHFRFTPEEVRQYEEKNGTLSALEWLALIPPDRFDGDWRKVYDELESKLYWGRANGVQQDKV